MANEKALRFTWWSLIAALLLACGGSDPKLPDPGRPFTEDEVYPATMPQIDQLRWHNETLTFYEAAPETVMLDVEGPLNEPEVRAAMNANTAWPLTPAEVWLALGGKDPGELPDVLAADHLRYVQADERPSDEYQRVSVPAEVVTEKFLEVNRLFAAQTALPAGHCWVHSAVSVTAPIAGGRNRYVCSSPTANTDFGGAAVHDQTAANDVDGVSCTHRAKSVRLHVGGYLDNVLTNNVSTQVAIKRYTCSNFDNCPAGNCLTRACAPENQAVTNHYSFNELLAADFGTAVALGYHNDARPESYQVTWGVATEGVGVPSFDSGGRCP